MVDDSTHILIADDTPINRRLLTTVLKKFYQVHIARDGLQALEMANKIKPDLILLDVNMPVMDGFSACRKLKASQATGEIPVIFLTARTATEDIVKGFESGAVDYLTKPFKSQELLARVRTHLEMKRKDKKIYKLSQAVEQSPVSIIITDTEGKIEYVNPKFSQVTGFSFEEALGKNPCILNSGKTPPEKYREMWDTIISGKEWRGELCNKKRNGDFFWEVASITSLKDNQGEITHFLAVKEDITDRKTLEELVKKQNHELHKINMKLNARNRELSLLSVTDQLTGLYNRRYLERKARELINRCNRFGENLVLVMLDIDHFKSVNDRFGHDVGDEVLVTISTLLREKTRKVDVVSRWGGEEFIILIQTDDSGAIAFTEKLRLAIMEKKHHKADAVTASFGITKYVKGDNLDTLIKRADRALYRAKENGRNRVEKFFVEIKN